MLHDEASISYSTIDLAPGGPHLRRTDRDRDRDRLLGTTYHFKVSTFIDALSPTLSPKFLALPRASVHPVAGLPTRSRYR